MPLVGREQELLVLGTRIAAALEGAGGLLLVGGEAGIGKTALVEHAAAQADARVLRGGATAFAPAPFAPLVEALRAHERTEPGALARSGPLSPQLAALLPELGAPPAAADDLALAEALGDAVRAAGPAVLLLEDLHRSDAATLGLLPALAPRLRAAPVLVVATFRSDELPRDHRLRAVRRELRRTHALEELAVGPLDAAATVELAAVLLGRAPGPELAAELVDRAEGVPFFVEELVAALSAGDGDGLPQSVRDAVRVDTDRLTPAGRATLELAAVTGEEAELSLLVALEGEDGVAEALERGPLVEARPGVARFRHALVREAVAADVPWTRRRARHAAVAEHLEAVGAAPEALAEHWLGAGDAARARTHLVRAAERAAGMHAFCDAAAAARRALDGWPAEEDEARRRATLGLLAHSAELCGELGEAARAWEELADAAQAEGRDGDHGDAARRLAGIHVLQGAPQRARLARERAAGALEAAGRDAEALAERVAVAEALELAGGGAAALRAVEEAVEVAAALGDPALEVRVRALAGELRSKQGDGPGGIAGAREALALALAHGDVTTAAEAYYRLGAAMENASEHGGAVDAYTTAREFCQEHGIAELAQVCFACMLPAVLLTGEWERMVEVGRGVLAGAASPPVARAKAEVHLGIVRALRGDARSAVPLLEDALAFGRAAEVFPIEVFASWGRARAHVLEREDETAVALLEHAIGRIGERHEHHYSVPLLRWASTVFAKRGDARQAGACAELLSRSAAATGHPECLGPLAHALGELALLAGDAEAAAGHFGRAVALLGESGTVYERAECQVRAAAACAAAGDHDDAVRRLADAHRVARRLAARPLALEAAAALRALGEPVEQRLGRRAAAELDGAGLSRREREVLGLVAEGLTNREIAARLVLSKRTVDMHVRNLLAKLGCRSRAEAVTRGHDLHLLTA